MARTYRNPEAFRAGRKIISPIRQPHDVILDEDGKIHDRDGAEAWTPSSKRYAKREVTRARRRLNRRVIRDAVESSSEDSIESV